jgi:predicted O-methyltransferase YrrM
MVRHEYQDLDSLVAAFGREPFPEVYSGLNPRFMNGEFEFPAFEHEDTKHWLAIKKGALQGVEKTSTTSELVRDFREADEGDQRFVAYNLSHEWKIATLAASVALASESRNVFELGPCFGLSSVHYSHLIKEKGINSSAPISRLTAIDHSGQFMENARYLMTISGIRGAYAGDIEFVTGDGVAYLRKRLKKGDLVFASVAVLRVVEGILDLLKLRPFDFVASYSESTQAILKRKRGKAIEDLVDPGTHEIFPFEDKEYHAHVPDDLRRMGVLARMAS